MDPDSALDFKKVFNVTHITDETKNKLTFNVHQVTVNDISQLSIRGEKK